MNLFYIKISENSEKSYGCPDEYQFYIVANNEEEAMNVMKEDLLEYYDEEELKAFENITITKEDFIYTGNKTEPFVVDRKATDY